MSVNLFHTADIWHMSRYVLLCYQSR